MKPVALTDFELHWLRYKLAARLVSAGIDIPPVKGLLGHGDIRRSIVCAKADTESLRGDVEQLNNWSKGAVRCFVCCA